MRIYLRGQMAQPTAKTYHRTTVYLTDEQRQWLRRAAAKATLEGMTVSGTGCLRPAPLTAARAGLRQAAPPGPGYARARRSRTVPRTRQAWPTDKLNPLSQG